jgi:MFS family permease
MLVFSARAGALAQRIGPRLPMTLGPAVVAIGMLLMIRITPGASYAPAVLPAVLVFSAGLALTVAPLTATVLAAADSRHSGVASGVNNAVARVGGLLAVAAVPLVAGINPAHDVAAKTLVSGFHTTMMASAGLLAIGAVIAYAFIRSDVLAVPTAEKEPVAGEQEPCYHCGVGGPPATVTHVSA